MNNMGKQKTTMSAPILQDMEHPPDDGFARPC